MLGEKEKHVQKLRQNFVVVLQGVPFNVHGALKLGNSANLGREEAVSSWK